MRRLANFYIILFLIDACLSLVVELLAVAETPVPLLPEVRSLVANAVLILSVVLFGCLAIDRRLPKSLLLPLILYIAWCALGL